jgi:hypothetical protein
MQIKLKKLKWDRDFTYYSYYHLKTEKKTAPKDLKKLSGRAAENQSTIREFRPLL